ncbi:hypothetical protein PAMC26577_23500 [Caballeronia sordidicola]|uniref:Uncharacterized protein n=1 Tax=Caballeronia sordidicola TaxID=196367 RepID=A0A242MJD4_CABSO|nr:hypothetical protein PAMC26577_23500 [Caballeronia sordidicola]
MSLQVISTFETGCRRSMTDQKPIERQLNAYCMPMTGYN